MTLRAVLAGLVSVGVVSAGAGNVWGTAVTPASQAATPDVPAAQVAPPVEPVTDAALEAAGNGRTVRVGSPGTGGVSVLPIEVYVARVLAGEAAPNTPDGALQALAIAARTYTIVNAGRHDREGFDVCDTTHCQVYRAATPATRRAVLASAGLVLTYNGTPAEVFYSASCGGHTERASEVWATGNQFPYLLGVDDDVHEGDPVWTLERSLDEVRDAVVRLGLRGRRLKDLRVDVRSGSGRVHAVADQGAEQETGRRTPAVFRPAGRAAAVVLPLGAVLAAASTLFDPPSTEPEPRGMYVAYATGPDNDNRGDEAGTAAMIGVLVGGILGAIIGHYTCDPVIAPPPPSPPPWPGCPHAGP